MDCTVWNERHRTRLACRRPGAGAHRDIDGGKVPSAARVACIARSTCTSLDQNSNKQNFSEQSGTIGRILRHIYTSIYYCCKSFPVLLNDVTVGRWSWRPGAVDCTVWNERHRTRRAFRRPGAWAHRDIERGKVPSAARVGCIARSACTSLDQNCYK